jgi:hypothetical protein
MRPEARPVHVSDLLGHVEAREDDCDLLNLLRRQPPWIIFPEETPDPTVGKRRAQILRRSNASDLVRCEIFLSSDPTDALNCLFPKLTTPLSGAQVSWPPRG